MEWIEISGTDSQTKKIDQSLAHRSSLCLNISMVELPDCLIAINAALYEAIKLFNNKTIHHCIDS